MASDYPTILQIVPIPATSPKLQHARVQGIVTSLTELGYDSIVCTYPQSKTINDAETRLIKSKKENIRTRDELEKIAFIINLKLIWLSIKTYQHSTPIALHSYGFRGLAISALVKLLFFWKKTPLICDLSEIDCEQLSAISRFSFNALFMKMANIVLCPTHNALETIQKTLHLDSTKLSLVVNGINSCTALSDDRISTIRTKLKLDKDKSIIAIKGGLEKGSDQLKELQKTILHFKEHDNKTRFLIVGEPKKYLYSFLKKNNARSMCSFVGDAPSKLLPQYYSVCDIALTLDRSNSNENRINVLNFMANALPVLSYETQLYKQYLPEDSPFSRSESGITNRLEELRDDHKWQKKLASNNIQKFEEYYSWEVSKEQLYATYMQALG